MQYLLLALQLALLYLRQYWLWCSTNYLPTDVFQLPLIFSAFIVSSLNKTSTIFSHKISCTLFMLQFNTLSFRLTPREETINERKLHVADYPHSIYILQYTSLPYQRTVQGLSFETPLSRRKFQFMSDKKRLRNFSGMTRSILEFGQQGKCSLKKGIWKGLCQGQKETLSSVTSGPSLSKSSRNKVRMFGVKNFVGKYFKILFKSIDILIEFETLKFSNFSRFHSEYCTKMEIRHWHELYAIRTLCRTKFHRPDISYVPLRQSRDVQLPS